METTVDVNVSIMTFLLVTFLTFLFYYQNDNKTVKSVSDSSSNII